MAFLRSWAVVEVDRLGTDYPGVLSGPTQTGLPGNWRGSMPPTVSKRKMPSPSSKVDHEPDLIHVGCNHYLQAV